MIYFSFSICLFFCTNEPGFFIFLTHTIVKKTDIFTPAYRLQTNKWVKEYIERTSFFVCIIFLVFFVFVRCPYNLRETFVLIRQFLTFVISCFCCHFYLYFLVFLFMCIYISYFSLKCKIVYYLWVFYLEKKIIILIWLKSGDFEKIFRRKVLI